MSTRQLHKLPLSVRAATLNEDLRTVDAVISTDQPVLMVERGEVVSEVLIPRGFRADESIPLLDAHNRGSIHDQIGSVREFMAGDHEVRARLYLADTEAGREAMQLIREGHLRDVSVGYQVEAAEELEPGETRMVQDRMCTAPEDKKMRIAVSWRAFEVSLVPIGADDRAKLRAKQTTENEEGAMPQDSESLEATSPQDAGEKREAPPVVTTTSASDIVKAERSRIAAITELAGEHKDIAQRAIEQGLTVDQAAREILKAERASAATSSGQIAPEVHVRGTYANGSDDQLRALSWGIRHQTRSANPRNKVEERAAEQGEAFTDLTLIDIMRESLRAVGHRNLPRGRHAIMKEWFHEASRSRSLGLYTRSGGPSVMDLANVFTDNVNAELVRSFEEFDDPYRNVVKVADVPDFRSNERPRAGQLPDLEKLPRGDAAVHATLNDIGESYKAARYAQQTVIDEQDIIDDRFDLFSDLPRKHGMAAARVAPSLIAYILLNGETAGLSAGALFSSGNSNLGSAALASAGLRAGIQAMMAQTEDGVPLNIMPKFLIVTPNLYFTARELVESSLIVVAGSADVVRGDANVLQNALTIVVDNRIEAGVTDPATGTAIAGDNDAWYLAADPALYPTIEVGYVRGTGRLPRLRSDVLMRGRYGIAYDVSIDVGAKALGYQGLYSSTPA